MQWIQRNIDAEMKHAREDMAFLNQVHHPRFCLFLFYFVLFWCNKLSLQMYLERSCFFVYPFYYKKPSWHILFISSLTLYTPPLTLYTLSLTPYTLSLSLPPRLQSLRSNWRKTKGIVFFSLSFFFCFCFFFAFLFLFFKMADGELVFFFSFSSLRFCSFARMISRLLLMSYLLCW